MKGYLMTGRASADMAGIEEFTADRWGERQADRYLTDLTNHFDDLVRDPTLGELRGNRSRPFLMSRLASHFVIYDVYNDWIIVAALPHARQDIEGLVRGLEPDYVRELNEIRSRFPALDDDGTIRGG